MSVMYSVQVMTEKVLLPYGDVMGNIRVWHSMVVIHGTLFTIKW